MRPPQFLVLALSLVLVSQIVPGAESPADLVVLNGKIVTVDPRSSIVEAAAVRDGRFVAVGANVEVKKLVSDGTRVIDAHGKTVVPGLIDAAYLSFDEKRKGSIEVGKLGDFTMLSDDLLTCEAERIKDIQPLATVVGGKVVHDAASR